MNKKQDAGSFKVFALIAGLVALMAVLVCVTPAFADNLYASIRGTVTDPTGAAVPNLTVTATNKDTGIVTRVTTSAAGTYVFPQLQICLLYTSDAADE